MKIKLTHLAIMLTLAMFFNVSCQQQQPTDEEFRENLGDIKQGMQEVVKTVDEALNAENTGELIQRSDFALNQLENQIDDYLDEMDNAARRIDKESRDRIISIKQKIVETDFRLGLLDDNEYVKRYEQMYNEDTIIVRRTRPVTYRFPSITAMDDAVAEDRVQYGEEVVEELKEDLKVLKAEVESFIQNSL